MSAPRDASSRFWWPPTIYGALGGAAYALSRLAPLGFEAPAALRWAGWGLIGIGGLVALAAELSFLRVGTGTLPTSSTTAIVSSGVFRFTRNPIYLGLTLAMIGLGGALGSVWFWLATPAAVALVTEFAIKPEEAYLARKFGATYLDYKRRVRRWL